MVFILLWLILRQTLEAVQRDQEQEQLSSLASDKLHRKLISSSLSEAKSKQRLVYTIFAIQ